MASKPPIRASKENARKVKKLMAKLLDGTGHLTEKETWLINEFLDRAIGRLPTDEAIDRDRAKKKKARRAAAK